MCTILFFIAKSVEYASEMTAFGYLTLLHSEWPKLYGVLAILSAIGLNLSNSVCKFLLAENVTNM